MSETMSTEYDESQAPILLRVRRPRRGAITASSATLRVELDAALAAAGDAFDDWDISASGENDYDEQLRVNESTVNESGANKIRPHHHRVSVSSRSRQSITSISTLTTTTSTAIFRRIDSSSLISHDESAAMHRNSCTFPNNKRPRILDAVLLADDADDDGTDDDSNGHDESTENRKHGNQNRSKKLNGKKKRRRLTLQILEPQKVAEEQQRRRSSRLIQYPILSPQQRAIDDSLQQVFAGTVTLQQHCQLMHESARTPASEESCHVFWPYVWCHADDGNWLHAAAIWNEASIVRDLFHILEERFDQLQLEKPTVAHQHKHASLIREMIQMENSEGLNPIQVAHLSSNSEIQAVLEHYYNIYNEEDDLMNVVDTNDDEHHYELYSLVVTNQNLDSQNNIESAVKAQHIGDRQQLPDENDDDPLLVTNCELHNGCRGYWDERGNLILEAPASSALDLDLDPNDNNQNSAHQENVDDIDSNDEDWDGNDYPDDDDDHEFASEDDQASDNEDFDDFRRRHVHLYSRNHRNVVNCNSVDDSDEDDAHYDPSYGDIYGQNDSLYR